MNIFAHLVIGHPDPHRMLGQFLGDFAKGPVEDLPYPDTVRAGIRAHRRIDAVGDVHPFVRHAKSLLPPEQRRFGGVVLDVYTDYLLHHTWARTMASDRSAVLRDIDTLLRHPPVPLPPDAARFAGFLLREHLPARYANPDTLTEVLARMSHRLRRPVDLPGILEQFRYHEEDLLRRFPQYFRDMREGPA